MKINQPLARINKVTDQFFSDVSGVEDRDWGQNGRIASTAELSAALMMALYLFGLW